MTRKIVIMAAVALALAACNSGNDAVAPPEPPAADASLDELETFATEYSAWLDECDDFLACAEQVENDPRYAEFNADVENMDDFGAQDPSGSTDSTDDDCLAEIEEEQDRLSREMMSYEDGHEMTAQEEVEYDELVGEYNDSVDRYNRALDGCE